MMKNKKLDFRKKKYPYDMEDSVFKIVRTYKKDLKAFYLKNR